MPPPPPPGRPSWKPPDSSAPHTRVLLVGGPLAGRNVALKTGRN